MQHLAKFKKILYVGFGATLNFRKFKVALNPMYRICRKLFRPKSVEDPAQFRSPLFILSHLTAGVTRTTQ